MQAGEEVQAGPPHLPQATPFQASWHTCTQRDSSLPAQRPMGVGRSLLVPLSFQHYFQTHLSQTLLSTQV